MPSAAHLTDDAVRGGRTESESAISRATSPKSSSSSSGSSAPVNVIQFDKYRTVMDHLKRLQGNTMEKLQKLRVIWLGLAVIFIVLQSYIYPARVIFQFNEKARLFYFDIVINVYYILDLYLRPKFFDKIEKGKKSFQRWWTFNLFLSVPWPWLLLTVGWNAFYIAQCIQLIRFVFIFYFYFLFFYLLCFFI